MSRHALPETATGTLPGLLWDFDGTLADTMAVAGEAYVLAAGLPGMTPELKHDLATVGSREVSLALGLDADAVTRRFQELLTATPPEAKPLFPGVRDVLECLPSHALATNGPAPAARAALEAQGVASCFSAIVGTESGLPRKPDAGLYRSLLGGGFRAGLVLGDRELDAAPARELGLPFVAFRSPGLSADYHLDRWDSLLPVLLLVALGGVRREGGAEAVSRELLAGTGRLDHAVAVGSALGGSPAAWLHDAGYGAPVTGYHPLDSALVAASLGFDEGVVVPVLLHGGFALVMPAGHQLYPLVQLAVRVAAGRPDIAGTLDALDRADCTTGPDGRRVTAPERLAEVRSRVGDTVAVRGFADRMEELGLLDAGDTDQTGGAR